MPDINFLKEHLGPVIANLIDLGSSVLRWRSIWTKDLNISGVGTITRTPTAGTDIPNKTYVDTSGIASTVEEVDGVPSITTASKIQFDQADGFVVTNPSGSIARIDITAIPSANLATVAVAQGGTGLTTSPITVALGGTGATTLATGAYLKGAAAAAITTQAVPIPVADGGTAAITFTAGYIKSPGGTGALTGNAVPIPTADGGSGVSSPTVNGILVAEGAAAFVSKVLTSGQLLIGSTGVDPVAAALTAGTNVTITNAAGAITIAAASASPAVFF